MREANSPTRPLVAWMDVLDHIDQSLGQSLARTPEAEPMADPVEPPTNHLARLDERLGAWHASLAQVERQAATSTERLNAEHAAFTEWLDGLGKARDRFARWLEVPPRR